MDIPLSYNETFMLTSLLAFPRNSVYAFINDEEKAIYINTSRSTLRAFVGHVESFKDRCHPIPALQAAFDSGRIAPAILEDVQDIRQLRYRLNYYIDYYTNLGYTLYNKIKVKAEIKKEYHVRRNEIHVVVVNSRFEKILLAKFSNEDDAEDFISSNYGEGKVYKLVYGER